MTITATGFTRLLHEIEIDLIKLNYYCKHKNIDRLKQFLLDFHNKAHCLSELIDELPLEMKCSYHDKMSQFNKIWEYLFINGWDRTPPPLLELAIIEGLKGNLSKADALISPLSDEQLFLEEHFNLNSITRLFDTLELGNNYSNNFDLIFKTLLRPIGYIHYLTREIKYHYDELGMHILTDKYTSDNNPFNKFINIEPMRSGVNYYLDFINQRKYLYSDVAEIASFLNQENENLLNSSNGVTRDDAIKTCMKHLNSFQGKNNYGCNIMESDEEYRRLLEISVDFVLTNQIPSNQGGFKINGISMAAIRYTYYCIHKDLHGTSRIIKSFIDFLHKFFPFQFENCSTDTTKTKFSDRPKKYPF